MTLFDDESEERDDSTSTAAHTEASTLVPAELDDEDPNGTLKRVIDEEAGVVLYAYKNGYAGGLSAVPLTETEFNGEQSSDVPS